MSVEQSEQEVLEENLNRALGEAETKITKALESVINEMEESEKDLWAAAEATEYASLVYALTHSLEDSTVNTAGRKEAEDTLTIVKEASQNLKTAQTLRRRRDKDSLLEGYKLLRRATDALRNTYLTMTKTNTKPPVTN